ncbi:methyltransferase domain-containing protein [Marinospirillum alkaliphilum]|uniref:Malonyl-[acyl-carrier protein] O-methyltransferase n=1 Tax=Marinospirillum alkaliphilum DSM 21637 TaxID=1122209 RepID=A0A1K1YYV5_9GAMM|nr:methyltransferase domain-containing protein [Marinospirillum alkaliphilum]SFX67118.1 malonyl-CoA O-methyltransferase [Marinospirillum alkaliphilum DSM 21637]
MNRPVQACFDRGANAYLQLAQAQVQMTSKLWALRPIHAQRVLDLGCGPGHWTRQLEEAYPQAQVLGVDLSQQMLREARSVTANRSSIGWLQADAAALPLPSATFDLVFSSLMLQWCTDPCRVLQEMRHVLQPGGTACIATLLPGSLQEIDQVWTQTGLQSQVLPFHRLAAYQDWVEQSGLQALQMTVSRETFYYADARRLLASVRAVGAGAASVTRGLTPGLWQRLQAGFEQYRSPQGLPLTYQLLIMQLRKP